MTILVRHHPTGKWFETDDKGNVTNPLLSRGYAESCIRDAEVRTAYLKSKNTPEWVPVDDVNDEWNFDSFIIR